MDSFGGFGGSQFAAENDRVARRLKQDSEDISRALDEFLAERNAATKMQRDALDNYDQEIANIGVIEGEDDMEVAEVDHNVMRHMNLTKQSNEKLDFNEYADDEFEADVDADLMAQIKAIQRMSSSTKKGPPEVELMTKKEIPGFEDKVKLRTEIFNFLDGCRIEEMQLELEFERVKEQGGLVAEKAAETLFAVQKRNHEQLKDMFDEYQPVAFGKAWGNDPDYQLMSDTLKKMISSDDHLNIDEIIGKKKKKKSVRKKSQ